MRRLSEDLRNGRISPRDWQTGMRGEIKRVHLNGAAAAKGGWAHLSPADYGWVGRIVRGQYEYLACPRMYSVWPESSFQDPIT